MSTRSTVVKAQAALKAEAKRRVKRVGTAAKQLEEDLKWIANNKAWELLGYENLATMFEGENGYPLPPLVRNIVAYALFDEGMRGRGQGSGPEHTNLEVANMLGIPASSRSNGVPKSKVVQTLLAQHREGIPATEATAGQKTWTDRKRGQNRQIGAGPNDLVSVSFGLPRRARDWYRNEAKTAVTPLPDAELYRQVLIAHMDKVEAGRKASRRTSRSKGRAA